MNSTLDIVAAGEGLLNVCASESPSLQVRHKQDAEKRLGKQMPHRELGFLESFEPKCG